MLGNNLVNFIQTNKLEEIEVQTCWQDQLVFSVYLNEEHSVEIEYNWNFDGEHYIKYFEWGDDCDLNVERLITTEESLKLRGLTE